MRRQMGAQPQSRTVQLRLGGPVRHAEQVGDLAMFEPLDVVKHEDGARAGRQRRERAFEIQPIDDAQHGPYGAWTRDHVAVELLSHLRPPTGPASKVVDAEVRREPVQPGAQGRFTLVRLELAVRRQEGFLEQVFGLDASHQAANQPEEARRVGSVKILERTGNPRAATLRKG